MAVINVEVEMAGSSDAEAAPIRQISVSAVLRGMSESGSPQPAPPQQPEPETAE